MKTIDARGEICPKPLIMAKKGLKESSANEVFLLLIDNETSKNNVERFLRENQVSFVTTNQDGHYILKITKGDQELINENATEFCPISNPTLTQGDLIVINKESIGLGPEELSAKLVKGFFTTLLEISPLPLGIVFYNSGVKLALNDSSVIEELRELEKKGVTILVCGTCIDHYQVKEQLSIGTISNMYDILSLMQKAQKVFTP